MATKKAVVKAGGQTHKVFKKTTDRGIGDKGDIVVDHTAGRPAGKWDKINLTNKAKAKTVKQGVASVKKWHKDNPNYGKDRSMAKVRGKDPKGGLNRKGVASYRRENPGSKLKMAVTTPPSKLKKGSKAANRRKSFCARMSGVQGPMKKPNGKPTRKALALRKWNC